VNWANIIDPATGRPDPDKALGMLRPSPAKPVDLRDVLAHAHHAHDETAAEAPCVGRALRHRLSPIASRS
jgi:hypothetical protein